MAENPRRRKLDPEIVERILRDIFAIPHESAIPCLNNEELVAWVVDLPTRRAVEDLDSHLNWCEPCLDGTEALLDFFSLDLHEAKTREDKEVLKIKMLRALNCPEN